MTIKQHGGVFGRNPSFNDISVETLSIAGTALSSTAAELNILDGVTADSTELNYLDGASTSVVTASKAVLANSSANIAFASGKGIDFSATSGTGTSELFDDYEEGLHTASITASTSGTVTLNTTADTLQYTKIGRLVTVSGMLEVNSISSPVGYAAISLPFAINDLDKLAGRAASSVCIDGASSVSPNGFHGILVEGTSEVRVYVSNSGTSLSATAANQMQANTAIWVCVSYTV